MGNFNNSSFSVAVKQKVTFTIDHDRASDLVLPIIVVSNASKRTFDTAQNDGYIWISFLTTLAVYQSTSVGALAAYAARRIGIITSNLSVRSVAVDHRIHVTRCDTEKQVRLAKYFVRIGALPIGLGDDADSKALILQ